MQCITMGECSSASTGHSAAPTCKRKHGITPAIADEALEDPNRVMIDPDYNSESGKSVRIIGFSVDGG